VNIAHHGNTSAASIPMALCDALDEGRVSPNDTIAITAFGGGVTWGSAIFRWGERVSRRKTSDAALPEPTGDVFDVLAPNREFYSSYHE
jgi:3-oxoacyl-[acyl-carrier-protein] synthase-3